jgi:enoyl-CoA hydratase
VAAAEGREVNSVLLVDRSDGIATLTLNRPEALNALSRELRAALVQAFRDAAGDDSVGVVILTGSGRAFSAGLDLKELETPKEASEIESAVSDGDVIGAMAACGKPIIGAINGFAVTGGFEIALACDILIASTEARFADTHARVGIMPGWGLSQRLSRAVGIYRAKELSLTGNFLSAERGLEWGLVNAVVPPAELLPAARALAEDVLSTVPDVVRGIKKTIDDGFAMTLADALRMERDRSRAHAKGVTPETIAARRKAMQQRSRGKAR